MGAESSCQKQAQKLLGHSNLSTTADIYTHTSAEAERDAAVAVERAIYGDLFPIVPKTGNRNSQTATKEGKEGRKAPLAKMPVARESARRSRCVLPAAPGTNFLDLTIPQIALVHQL